MLGTTFGYINLFSLGTYDGLGILLLEGSADDVVSYAVCILRPIVLCILSFSSKIILFTDNKGSCILPCVHHLGLHDGGPKVVIVSQYEELVGRYIYSM